VDTNGLCPLRGSIVAPRYRVVETVFTGRLP
jgi:hypothetical protein